MTVLERLTEIEDVHYRDMNIDTIEAILKDIGKKVIPPNYSDSLTSFLVSAFLYYSSEGSYNEMRAYAEKDDVTRGYYILNAQSCLDKLTEIIAKAEERKKPFSPYFLENPDGTSTDTSLDHIKIGIGLQRLGLEYLEAIPSEKKYTLNRHMGEMKSAIASEDYERAGKIKRELEKLKNS